MSATRSIIFDIGLHHGEDTDFYLRKGFDVVAVEANPDLCAKAREQFASFIDEGRLEIVDAAIAAAPGEVDFYLNLDKDDWSSTDPRYGTREGTRHEKITVPAVTFHSLYARVVECGLQSGKSGSPAGEARRVHYVKCDIEGGDVHVLEDLVRLPAAIRPPRVSVEGHTVDYLAYLRVAGYGRFKIVNQNLVWRQKAPNPALEGEYVEYQFQEHASGLFGDEAPGRWLNYGQCLDMFLAAMRVASTYPAMHVGWYDFHAAIGAPVPASARAPASAAPPASAVAPASATATTS